jgi:hypothetical protein
VAQAPARFRGSVTIAGQELVTLAFDEQRYGLRTRLDPPPPGFYSGPADPCAVEALLGVSIGLADLVAIVLGGGPVPAGSGELVVLEQRWDRRAGVERLRFRVDGSERELRLGWHNGQWRVDGATVWALDGANRGAELWRFDHVRRARRGGEPTRTVIRHARASITLEIRERDGEPAFAHGTAAAASAPTSQPDDGWEPWDDDEPGVAPEHDPGVAALPPAGVDPRAPTIPGVFRLDGGGLVDRGDLCARDGTAAAGEPRGLPPR